MSEEWSQEISQTFVMEEFWSQMEGVVTDEVGS